MTSRPLERDLAATAAVSAYSLVIAAGFARVFSGWAFFGDLATIVVLGHGVSFAFRRLQVTGWFSIPFTSVLLSWVLLVQEYRSTMSWLVPTGATWNRLELEIGLVRDQFETAVAPVLYGAGWATLAGAAVVITVVLADAFAFHAEARGEALVPGGVLFVFIAALGSERLRITLTAVLIGVGIVAVVALRSLHDRHRRVELRPAGSSGSLVVPAAVATAVAIAVLAGFIGPRLPGANAEPLYDTKGRGGGVTNIVSPLVDIRSRLTNRGDEELFRVAADSRSYWRVTTLPAFDGRRYSLPERRLERVEDATQGDATGVQIRQQIMIVGLGGRLIPAAADPIGAEGFSAGNELDLSINYDTNSLLAPDEHTPGDVFRLVSTRPGLDPDVLRDATSDSPPDPIFLELPDDLPTVVGDTARTVAGDATSTYDQAMALQNWFQDGDEFRYSTEVQSGHGANAIESFLNERVGYCEQFAATFATMARSLGIPSRVAVGFTWGTLDDEGWYRVIGKNAHAWPELWFDGIGWVLFEPTPGRGAPGAEAYTGRAADQDDSGPTGIGADQDGSVSSTLPPTPTTIATPQTTLPADGSSAPTTTSPSGAALPIEGDVPLGGGDAPADSDGVPWWVLLPIAAIAIALAAPWASRRLAERRDRSARPADRVRRAWERAVGAASSAGVRGSPSMTVHEWAGATAASLPVAERPMSSLATAVEQVLFGPPGRADLDLTGPGGDALGRECELWSDQVRRIAADAQSTGERIRGHFTTWS